MRRSIVYELGASLRQRRPACGVWVFALCAVCVAGRSVAATGVCAACEGRMVIALNTFVAASLLVAYEIPHLSSAGGPSFSDPVVVSITADARGHVCNAALVRGEASPHTQAILASMRKWKFRAPRYNGSNICMRTRFFVYARGRPGRVVAMIPGVTDRRTAQRATPAQNGRR